MLKKIITFEDLEGNVVEREYYFNLNKAELLKMQLASTGGLDKKLEKIRNTNDYHGLLEFISDLVLKSYGEKDDDGIRFIKTRNGVRLADGFKESEAYSELIMELTSDADAFNTFINGIIPTAVAKQIAVNK